MDKKEAIVYMEFSSDFEAYLVKGILDTYDIPCFLSGENMSSLYPVNSQGLGRIQLHIFEKDREKADRLLQEQEDIENA